jgi:hypothetical protein
MSRLPGRGVVLPYPVFGWVVVTQPNWHGPGDRRKMSASEGHAIGGSSVELSRQLSALGASGSGSDGKLCTPVLRERRKLLQTGPACLGTPNRGQLVCHGGTLAVRGQRHERRCKWAVWEGVMRCVFLRRFALCSGL